MLVSNITPPPIKELDCSNCLWASAETCRNCRAEEAERREYKQAYQRIMAKCQPNRTLGEILSGGK